jgi:ATP/maltotriose-dependent transcriptional regulator MalT
MALAKTTRPAQTGILVRRRLVRQLDLARKKPGTWVWAPPGAGKTTLVATYLAARKTRGLWYQIDEGDADVATFFYYLGLATPPRRRPLPLLTSEYGQGVTLFARRFFRELYSRFKPPFAVVFDNYQDAPPDSALHDVMAEAVAEVPEGGRLIFISRSDPPPTFAHHRVHQHLAILGWSQLRFTPAEATQLARTRAPGRWPREAIRSLHDTTDGWCAGLVLLLDQLRSEGRASPAPSERDLFRSRLERPGRPGGLPQLAGPVPARRYVLEPGSRESGDRRLSPVRRRQHPPGRAVQRSHRSRIVSALEEDLDIEP